MFRYDLAVHQRHEMSIHLGKRWSNDQVFDKKTNDEISHLLALYWVYCWYCGWKLWKASVIMSLGLTVSYLDHKIDDISFSIRTRSIIKIPSNCSRYFAWWLCDRVNRWRNFGRKPSRGKRSARPRQRNPFQCRPIGERVYIINDCH